ncbi:chromosome partitioning ATPase-like protein [Desulfofarcimen acetoxidans DSM 771]|uniref:Chromosome partitioning ATPase-like protein n=1 Tax=Desulfofarcimen acetoxidans (strain ATCC 49208 / DSM 771 / KCTC 5769 / VKM B-1644 / 5575) TaxID=485916 RepID=C8W0Q3_DESAS|nr:cellulose synthase operon protein YhjQ/BcsQ [Desulfofarcimen acetoxidans]ACV63308.1 chromosome partitioning ATPase-like protein [Desulfofarcimen acetoxidans DSM 771]
MIISVVGAVSGVGTTVIAANIAVVLTNNGYNVLLVEMSGGTDIQNELSISPEKLITKADIVNRHNKQIFITEYGLSVLPGSDHGTIEDMSVIQEEIKKIAYSYDYIILDTGNLKLPMANESFADIVMLVTEPSRRCLIKNGHLNAQQVLIINKVSPKAVYHPRDIARCYKTDNKYFEIVEDVASVKKSMQQHQPIALCGKKFGEGIENIISTVLTKKKSGIQPMDQLKQSILLATGDEDLHEAISTSISCLPVIAVNRKTLLELASSIEPDMILFSGNLPGDIDILEVATQIGQISDKILFISNMQADDITLARIKELGIEALSGEISIGAILKTVCSRLSITGNTTNQDEHEHYSPVDVEEEDEDTESAFTKIVRSGTEMAGKITDKLSSVNLPNLPKNRLARKHNVRVDNLIAVVSPVTAGKTFVSINLATTLALNGYSVALIDADMRNQSVYTWLALDADSLTEALKDDDPLSFAYKNPMIPNLHVFSSDPYTPAPVNIKSLANLIGNLKEEVDIIIVDTYRNLTEPVTKKIIDMASNVIMVADQDFCHLVKIQKEFDLLESSLDFNNFTLIVNQMVSSKELEISDAEKAAGLQAEGLVQKKSKEVLESIKSGIPVALFCPDVKMAFYDFWIKHEKMLALA